MRGARVCIRPVIFKEKEYEKFKYFLEPERVKYVNQLKPYLLEFEITSKCAGSCRYCYSSSTIFTETLVPKKRALELIDEACEIGIKDVCYSGGDPILHPDWYEIASYSLENGLQILIVTSGLISKDVAKKIRSLGNDVKMVGIHIDTLNQEAYNILHNDPKTLDMKIRGYHNLLDAGYPPDQVLGFITLTRISAEHIEETLDWYIDEMGAQCFDLLVFKYEGFGGGGQGWEPTLSQLKRAYEYRAKKLGDHWLSIGTSDAGAVSCRSLVTVLPDGSVVPCAMMRSEKCGNIFQQSIADIIDTHLNEICMNYEIKGYCGETCEYRNACFGCRATAYHYLGDKQASDPRCFMNPDAPEVMAKT